MPWNPEQPYHTSSYINDLFRCADFFIIGMNCPNATEYAAQRTIHAYRPFHHPSFALEIGPQNKTALLINTSIRLSFTVSAKTSSMSDEDDTSPFRNKMLPETRPNVSENLLWSRPITNTVAPWASRSRTIVLPRWPYPPVTRIILPTRLLDYSWFC